MGCDRGAGPRDRLSQQVTQTYIVCTQASAQTNGGYQVNIHNRAEVRSFYNTIYLSSENGPMNSSASGAPCYYRLVATNAIGSASGNDRSFTAPQFFQPGDTDGDGIISQAELDAVLSNYWSHSPWLYLTNVAGVGQTNVTFNLTNSTAGAFSFYHLHNS